METLAMNSAFETYAFCSAILGLKMLLSAIYTGTRRSQHQGYVNTEDATVFGKPGASAAALETPEVAHALRIQRNDLENIPLFFAIGLIYVITGASHFGAFVYCWTFMIARIVHTYCYMHHLQPGRAISFGAGALMTLGMILQILWRTL